MSLKRLVIALLVAVTISITNTSAAQEKNELAGMIGRTFISNQSIKGATFFNHEVRFGNGLTFEGNYARHVIDGDVFGVSLEVPVVIDWDEDLNTGANLMIESVSPYRTLAVGEPGRRVRPLQRKLNIIVWWTQPRQNRK